MNRECLAPINWRYCKFDYFVLNLSESSPNLLPLKLAKNEVDQFGFSETLWRSYGAIFSKILKILSNRQKSFLIFTSRGSLFSKVPAKPERECILQSISGGFPLCFAILFAREKHFSKPRI